MHPSSRPWKIARLFLFLISWVSGVAYAEDPVSPSDPVIDLPTLDILRQYRGGLDTTEPLPFGIYGRERGKIELPHNAIGYLLHHRLVQGVGIMPHVAGPERRADGAAKHGVAIGFGAGRFSSVKFRRDFGSFQHADRGRQNIVQSDDQVFRGDG